MENEMTITYRSRTFTIRAISDDHGNWTEAVAEVVREGETAEWDGSGMVYGSANECLAVTVQGVLDTVDDDEDGTR